MDNIELTKNALKDLENHEFYFYGYHDDKFKLDDMVLKINRSIRTNIDGVKVSYLGNVSHTFQDDFHTNPLCKVKLKYYSGTLTGVVTEFDGWYLVDLKTGYCILMFGTNKNGIDDTWIEIEYVPPTMRKVEVVDEEYVPFKEAHPEIVLKHYSWFCGKD